MAGLAFTREVSPRLAECALTHLGRVPIDAARAQLQHDAYEEALSDAGMEIIRLPELPDDPDAVFVEDTALLLEEHAIITRPGAPSRADEVGSTAAGLAGHFEIHRIERGHVDGGDVLRIGKMLHVGLSSRTNAEGIDALKEIAAGIGFDVVAAELRDCLHLKTAATLAGREVSGKPILLYNAKALDPGQFADVEPMAVAEDEPDAANVLWVGGRVIMPAGSPKTATRLRDRGIRVVEVDVSELQKAEAGVTCMSLVSER
jgi:dimethylargininase